MDYSSVMDDLERNSVLIIDTRNSDDYMAGHIRSSVNIPYSPYAWARSIKNWLDGESPALMVVTDSEDTSGRAISELRSVGLNVSDSITDGLKSWQEHGLPLASVEEISPEEMEPRMNEFTILDVREPFEWESGAVSGSLKIPMNDIPARIHELQKDSRYAIICAHGNRSRIVSVYLADNGYKVSNVTGGMQRWMDAGLPVDYDSD